MRQDILNELGVHYLGPRLEAGPHPTLLYFVLSSEESLSLDPFNQPAIYAAEKGWRVLSFGLPFHGPGYNNKDAMALWAKEALAGGNFLEDFLNKTVTTLALLAEKNAFTTLAVAGLSRGAFIALHLATRYPLINAIVGYAPLIELSILNEFKNAHPNAFLQHWDLVPQIPALLGKSLYFSIGNRDERVGTRTCFDFVEKLTEANYLKGLRTPPVELVLTPSIGAQGHGTSPSAFYAGIDWLKKSMN